MKHSATLPRAVATRLIARKSLDDYAAGFLAPDVVLAAITKAAADGFCILRLRPERPLDVQDTTAAKTLCDRLVRDGFELEWVGRLVLARENITATDMMVFDLLVRW